MLLLQLSSKNNFAKGGFFYRGWNFSKSVIMTSHLYIRDMRVIKVTFCWIKFPKDLLPNQFQFTGNDFAAFTQFAHVIFCIIVKCSPENVHTIDASIYGIAFSSSSLCSIKYVVKTIKHCISITFNLIFMYI